MEGQSEAQVGRRAGICVTLLLAAALAPPALGDRVKLANGRTLEGAVRDLGGAIELTLSFGGKVVLSKSEVLSIESESNLRGEYLRRAAATSSTDAGAQAALATWCRDRGLRAEMKEHLDRALLLDPRHPQALAMMGYADLAGRWPDLPPGWSTVTSEHFAVCSPLPVHEARGLAADLELFFQEFQRAYSARFPLRALAEPVRVVLHTDAEEFARVAREEFRIEAGVSENARAHLDGFADARENRLVAKIDRHLGPRNRETLYHEGTHLLVALQLEEGKRIAAPTAEELERIRQRETERLRAARGLMWFHEGLAGYYGGSSVSEGKFAPGLYMVGGQASVALARLKSAIRAEEDLPLNEVVAAGAAQYLGDGYVSYYAQSWMLVHFLLHHDGGKYRARWFKLVAEHRRQDGGVEAFKRAFGIAPSDLQEEWRRYVLEVREGQ